MDQMRRNDFIRLGAAASCMIRGVKDTSSSYRYIEETQVTNEYQDGDEPKQLEREQQKILYFAVNWLRSVKTTDDAMKSGHRCKIIIKTVHIRSPKMVRRDNGRFPRRFMDSTCIQGR